ncbi:imidazole glycerol phosphate synthase subunit HisF [Myroides sp. LJL115]
MVANRIIACMDILGDKVVKGINFVNLKTLGDPIAMALEYQNQQVDELVFLDISATVEQREPFLQLVKKIKDKISTPFCIGGGIKTLEQAKAIIQSGASKIAINSSAIENPNLIKELVQCLGSSKVVVAIDVKNIDGQWWVFTHGGNVQSKYKAVEWAQEVERLGAGEILLTSMNNDGQCQGFALDITKEIAHSVSIGVIASGGAGKVSDFVEVFEKTKATGALGASVFHYNEVSVDQIKRAIKQTNK